MLLTSLNVNKYNIDIVKITSATLSAIRLAAIVMLFLTLTELPGAYLTVFRWVILAAAVSGIFTSVRDGKKGWAGLFAIAGGLYNPVLPPQLSRQLWIPLGIVTAVAFGASFLAVPPLSRKRYEALIDAAHEGDAQAVRDLLRRGADVEARDSFGRTALLWAAIKGHTDVINIFLEINADVNAKGENDKTALIHASARGQTDIIRALLLGGADVNMGDRFGRTPLLWAAIKGNVETAKTLLENGADPNAKTNDGWPALMYAAFKGDADTVKILLTGGADANVETKLGMTPLMGAINRGHTQVATLLKEAGADE